MGFERKKRKLLVDDPLDLAQNRFKKQFCAKFVFEYCVAATWRRGSCEIMDRFVGNSGL